MPVPTFSVFGIPVRVRPSFLLIAALLGMSVGRVDALIAWVIVVFFSILIHELGHALTARSYGSEVEIELNAVGGLTTWSIPDEDFGPGRRAIVAAAGSAVGVAFGAAVWVFNLLTGPYFGLMGYVVQILIFVNLFWGVLNWLPIRPLDGGHLFVSLLQKFVPDHADRVANVVFGFTAALGLGAALYFKLYFAAILAGWFLLGEVTRNRRRREPVAIPPMSFDDDDEEEETQEPEEMDSREDG